MKETDETSNKLVQDMLSRDTNKIWSASCKICSLSQNHDRIMELVPYKEQMYSATRGIRLGGALAPNSRFLKQAFHILEMHESCLECPCSLLGENYNPIHLIEDGYFELIDTVYVSNSNYIDYYLVRCNRCKILYKVEEREYHCTWWSWQRVTE